MKTRRTRPASKKASGKSGRTEARSKGLIGALRGKLKVKGDLFSTGEHWKAQS